ncbi:MarR family winged helix-turn-helix transcriptional regulator [Arthrobacter sp. TWP1-1]|uniref:MarR family winged helix-turn-helix transcriptional regulator n=1 Tax=Arthrobacter sp. TWP1-1 TaxID=2804568 RepID=UPI003CEA6791
MSDRHEVPQRGKMHQASVLVRQVLVLNEEMEFIMRREMDINETDFQAMQHLMKQRTMSPGELAKLLHLTPAATTTVIDRLVRKGHVQRAPHPTDRRRWLISPSEDSVREAMEKLMPMILEVDEKVRGYDDAEQAAIVDFLGAVVGSMNSRITALQNSNPGPGGPTEPSNVER